MLRNVAGKWANDYSTDSLLFGSGADGEGAPEKFESVTSVDPPSADAADADLSIEVAGTRIELTVDIVTAG